MCIFHCNSLTPPVPDLAKYLPSCPFFSSALQMPRTSLPILHFTNLSLYLHPPKYRRFLLRKKKKSNKLYKDIEEILVKTRPSSKLQVSYFQNTFCIQYLPNSPAPRTLLLVQCCLRQAEGVMYPSAAHCLKHLQSITTAVLLWKVHMPCLAGMIMAWFVCSCLSDHSTNLWAAVLRHWY